MLDVNLLYPLNNQIVNTFTPVFQFQLKQNYGNVAYMVEIANNPSFTGSTKYSQIANLIQPHFVCHYDGAPGDIVFKDSSVYNHPIVNTALAVTKVASPVQFGSASAYSVNGPFRYLTTVDDPHFYFGTSPFTIETWCRADISIIAANYGSAYMHYSGAGGGTGLQILITPAPRLCVRLLIMTAGVVKINATAPLSKSVDKIFRHLCLTRDSNANKTIRFFIDGQLMFAIGGNFIFSPVAQPIYFIVNSTEESIWIDETRVLNGICRYNSNFTPPPVPYENSYVNGGNLGILSEWQKPFYNAMDAVNFAPPESRKIAPNGTYYWRVIAYPGDYQDMILAVSETRKLIIQGAAYKWKVGIDGGEVEFKPSHTSVTTETMKCGLLNNEKHKFKVDFAHMEKAKRDALYNEFSRKMALRFHDNMGNIYNVYWGECERSLNGTAHAPDKPVFGIDRSNLIGGALRWNGTAIFTEV